MRKVFIIVFFFWANLAISSHESGLEIKMYNFQMFENYKLQRNFTKNNPRGWDDLSFDNIKELNGLKYMSIDFNLINEEDDVFLRLLNKSNTFVSDIHKIHVREDCTTFLALDISHEGIVGNGEVNHNLSNYGNLKYYDITFRIKEYVEDPYGISLLQPSKNSVKATNAFFAWDNSCNNSPSFSSYLLIGREDQIYLQRINVTNLSSYNWSIPSNLSSGMYWWQISCENGQNELIESEKRVFYIISDTQDSDHDGYTDFEENIRNSNPNDPNDVPLFIISSPNCPSGNKGQQYFIQLNSNNKKDLVKWSTYSELPPGLRLSKSGIISGRPEEIGVYFFTIVADYRDKSDELTMSITINQSGESRLKIEGTVLTQ